MEQGVDVVITVMECDCSNTQALVRFSVTRAYNDPFFLSSPNGDKEVLVRKIEKLMAEMGVNNTTLARVERKMEAVRSSFAKIEEMTWKERRVIGAENHLWLVRASDMLGYHVKYDSMVRDFLAGVAQR